MLHQIEPKPETSVEIIFAEFLNTVRKATTLADVNIAAGVALEVLRQMTG